MSIPPGASYQASNTYVKLKRHLLNLEAPVRIQFKEDWKNGHPLYDWHRRHDPIMTAMELRRERDAPFFHQYIVFKLRSGRFFRIDRRQLPDEITPLDCIYEQGVEAFDTVEEVTSFDDSSYSPSDCLVGIVFPKGQTIETILKILWAIHQHPSAKAYTLQRYNCYFVAQTIISIVAQIDQDCHPGQPDSILSSISRSYNALGIVASTCQRHPYHPSNNTGTTLSRTLSDLFQQFAGLDHGLHNMCLAHFQTCLCTRGRAPFSSSMTFNAAGKIPNNPDRHHPIGFSDFILSRFLASLTGFWRQAISSTVEAQIDHAREKSTHISSKRHKSKWTLEELVHAIEQTVPENCYPTKSSWARCVREALQEFARDLGPIVQRTLDCPTWDLSLTPGIDAEGVAYFRKMDNWVEAMMVFFESEYDRLEDEFKSEVQTCLSAKPSLDPSQYSRMYFGSNNQTIPEPSDSEDSKPKHLMARLLSNRRSREKSNRRSWEKSDAHQSGIATTEVLINYIDKLVMAHCVRVEQYGRWLKCTRDGVYSDISRTREEILEVVGDASRWVADYENRLIFEQITDDWVTFLAW